MKDSLLTTHMYWSALHCVVELHLSGLHREKHTKKTPGGVLVASCCFCGLRPLGRVVSANTDSCGVLLRQTRVPRQDTSTRQDQGRTRDVWQEYKWDSKDRERGLLIELAVQCL